MASPGSFQRWSLIGLLLVGTAGAGTLGVSWWNEREVNQRLEVFYGDSQAMFLVPVEDSAVLPQRNKPEAWAQAVFERMRQAPNKDLTSLLTPDVKLIEASYRAPTWTVHVQIGQGMGSVSEWLLAGSLVRTFLGSYPGAEQMEIRFFGKDGRPYLSQHLDLSRPLTAAQFSNMLDGAAGTGLHATLWWRVPGDKLVPVQVALTGKSGSPPQDALERLVAGPPGEKQSFLLPVVPAGLTPHWDRLDGEVARIDLNREVPTGPEGERFIEATVLTLTEFTSVKAVQFLHDGLPMAATVGTYDLAQPVRRPREVKETSEKAAL